MSIRMNNEIRELRNQLGTALDNIEAAVSNGDAAAAEAAKNEADRLKTLLTAAEQAFEARRNMGIDPKDGADEGEDKYNAALFYKAICGKALNETEQKIIASAKAAYKNSYSEISKKDGGYTVPEDISTQIYESIKSKESVRNLVSVENVNSLSGSRIWRRGDANKLYNTEEAAEIKEMNNAQYEPTTYRQHKFAGLMSVSSELLEDSAVNFQQEITSWLSDAARVTENYEILYGVGGEKHCQGLISTAGAYKEVTAPSELTIDFFRTVSLALGSGYRANAGWVMNSLAFAKISEMKDGNGRSFIQPDPRTPDGFMILGYPISVMDIILTDEDNNTVLMFGDFKSAYRMFCRRDFGISFTDIGAGAFESDTLKAKGVERFDGRIFDKEALVIVRGLAVSPLTVSKSAESLSNDITEATLKNLTKAQLLELCDELEVAGMTNEKTKTEIVEAILAKINQSAEA